MSEVLVIMDAQRDPAGGGAVQRLATERQSISERVFVAELIAPLAELRAARGVAAVMTGIDDPVPLPELDPSETLFAEAWLSGQGRPKTRTGDGLDWDTPPMLPPDRDPDR